MPPDPPSGDEFIARGRTVEQVGEAMNQPVVYLSCEGMFKAFERAGMSRQDLCTYCIGGEHPFASFVSLDHFAMSSQLDLLKDAG